MRWFCFALFPASFAAKTILSAVTCRCPFFKAPLTTFCGSFLDSLPFVARSVCLSPRQGHAILITASLEIRQCVSSTGASSMTVWATLGLLPFCTNVTVTFSMSTKQLPMVFIGVALNQQIKSERAASLKMLSLPTREQRISVHLLRILPSLFSFLVYYI